MYPELRFGLARPGPLRRSLAGCDLVHLATPGPLAWVAGYAARAEGVPTTSDFRTNFHQYSRHYGLGLLAPGVLAALRRFHNATDCTFVPTAQVRRELAQRGFERLAVVGRGVDTARFGPHKRSAALRAAWGADAGDVVLLYVGRLAPEKNVPLALRAFEAARARDAKVRMVVVGDGPARAALQAAHPAARFVGMQQGEELAASYASADLFVFPSLSETFGNVTLEALASGLPVVAWRLGAAAEHIAPGVSGLPVEPPFEDAFIDAVLELVADPVRRSTMRDRALEVARRARWDEVVSRFEACLEEVLEGAAGQLAEVA
jgi:glycosyltransferase involved in cell wall biosynthesis